jgi:beta-xylosidase
MAAVNKNLVFHLRITRRHRDHLNVYNRQAMDRLTYLDQFNTRCVFMHKRMSTRIRKGIWPRQLKSKRRERELIFDYYFFFAKNGTESNEIVEKVKE